MRYSGERRNTRGLIITCVVLLIGLALPLFSSARSPSTSVNIVNNSNRVIRSVYLSHVDRADWSSNQLDGTTIGPGQSFSLNNAACDQQQVKVICEDQDGCFVSTVVACGQTVNWTITSDTAADCGDD